ncbi:MAG: MFS transporter [Pseudonocardia sp.]
MDDAVPLYAVYALLFLASGLSEGQIALLFGIWSTVAVLAEVPSGAWADRFSRRSAVVLASLLKAAGFTVWVSWPEFAGFAIGFVLWGIGGSLQSGAFEALVYDSLDAAGAADQYPGLMGRAQSVALVTEVLATAAATPLLLAGGYALVGWVSVGLSLAGAVLAARIPEARGRPQPAGEQESGANELGYFQVLRAGVAEIVTRPRVLAAALAVVLVTGLDGVEEFSPLLAGAWGVPASLVPLVLVALPLTAAGATAFSGAAARLPMLGVATLLATAAAALGAATLAAQPVGMAGFALWHGLLRLVIVLLDARLQDAITGPARATVTSVASLGTELSAIAVFGAYAGGGAGLVAAMALLIAVTLPGWLRVRR